MKIRSKLTYILKISFYLSFHLIIIIYFKLTCASINLKITYQTSDVMHNMCIEGSTILLKEIVNKIDEKNVEIILACSMKKFEL